MRRDDVRREHRDEEDRQPDCDGARAGPWGPLGKILTVTVLNPLVGQELGILPTEISTVDLEALADFIDGGTIQVVIDRTYTLQETPEAISYLETGHASAKVVITSRSTIDERSWRARRRVVVIG